MVNYGLVGCGMMGREHIKNILLLPNSKISGIYEPNQNMRELAKALVSDINFFESIKDLVTKARLDCLVIATPNFRHIEDLYEIKKFLEIPILLEKPAVTKILDIQRLLAFEREYQAPIWIAMEYRYMPVLKEFIAKAYQFTGGIEMLTVREHRFPFLQKVNKWNRFNKYSGGTFVEKCCHFFDIMRLILSSNPVRVMASGAQVCNHLEEFHEGKSADIWDSGYVLVDFENGSRAMLELCMFADASIYQEEISAVGKLGKIECKIIGPKRFWNQRNGDQPESKIIFNERKTKLITKKNIPVDPILLEAGDHNGSTFYQHQKFHQVVLEGKEVEVNIEDGIWAVRIGLAAEISAVKKRAVDLSEVI